jgi:hypothetical protein
MFYGRKRLDLRKESYSLNMHLAAGNSPRENSGDSDHDAGTATIHLAATSARH